MFKRFLVLIFAFLSVAHSTQNGLIIDNPVKNIGGSEINYFVKPSASGVGSCLSWSDACTFRTAVSKLNSNYTTTIYLSGGTFDTNNGSDGTGTTISTNYVCVVGMNDIYTNPLSKMINSHAAATHILRITGEYISVTDIVFNNIGQADPNVIMLNIRSSYNDVQRCCFMQSPGDGGGTGLLVDNNVNIGYIENNNFYSVVGSGIELGQSSNLTIKNCHFYSGGKGVYFSHASVQNVGLDNIEFLGLTTALDYATAAANTNYFNNLYFANNTNNVAAVAAYGSSWFQNITTGRSRSATYPTTTGVTCSTGDGVWTWTAAATTIIPAATLNKPFRLTDINFQNWNAAQTYKIELFYGEVTANISLGIFEITVGDPGANRGQANNCLPLNVYLPAYAIIGAKVMSSTDGVDDVTVTLSYDSL